MVSERAWGAHAGAGKGVAGHRCRPACAGFGAYRNGEDTFRVPCFSGPDETAGAGGDIGGRAAAGLCVAAEIPGIGHPRKSEAAPGGDRRAGGDHSRHPDRGYAAEGPAAHGEKTAPYSDHHTGIAVSDADQQDRAGRARDGESCDRGRAPRADRHEKGGAPDAVAGAAGSSVRAPSAAHRPVCDDRPARGGSGVSGAGGSPRPPWGSSCAWRCWDRTRTLSGAGERIPCGRSWAPWCFSTVRAAAA